MIQEINVKTSAGVISFQKDVLSEIALSEKIRKIANNIPYRNITVCEIVRILWNDGLLLFAVLLSVAFLIPVSIPFSVLGTFIYFGLFFSALILVFNKIVETSMLTRLTQQTDETNL